MNLIAKAGIQIQKPVESVFECIVNHEKMTKYFISESTGPLETGKEVLWRFPEFEGWYPVKATEIVQNQFISFVWDPETVVKISLKTQQDNSTLVLVLEDGKEMNEANLKWALENTEGWANFLACMKAYLEYGIHLRKGAFDYMRKA